MMNMDISMGNAIDYFEQAYTEDAIKPFGKIILAGSNAALMQFTGVPLQRLLNQEKLVLFRGFENLSKEDFVQFAASSGKNFLNWDFGSVMEMTPKEDAKNYLFSNEAVPFHWDGAFHKVPAYLIFHCIQAPTPGTGGETLFTDTTKIWKESRDEVKEIWKQVSLTYSTEKLAHYGGSITNPLLSTHPRRGEVTLRFAEAVNTKFNPVSLRVSGLNKTLSELFLRDLVRKIYSPKFCYTHTWQKGDLLIADNHALIHGRRAFHSDSPRHLRRIQLL